MGETPKQCAHGAPIPGECIECEIVWYQDCMNDAAKRVVSCNEEIRKLLLKRSAARRTEA